jgi:hypothetical protein
MKFHVRNEDGELEVPSYAELRKLYEHQFITDDDEVRREGTQRWVKAGQMPELRGAKPRPWFQGNEMAWIAVFLCVVTLLLLLLMPYR